MHKKKLIDKRSHSITKPLLYLLLQIIAVIELVGLLNGSFDMFLWSIYEHIVVSLLIVFFIVRTYKIVYRTKYTDSHWHDKIQMQKFIKDSP